VEPLGDHDLLVVVLLAPYHGTAVFIGHLHGLLAEHMYSGPGGSLAVFPVQVIGKDDIHRIHPSAPQAILVLRVRESLDLVLAAQLRSLLGIIRDQRHELGVLGVSERRQDRDLSNVAQAHDGIADLLGFLGDLARRHDVL
jgi:hypothetical protein